MALIIQKESELAAYLFPREGMIAPFDFGSDWTEIRCGIFFTVSSAESEAVNDSLNETLVVGDVSDLIAFGIKNSDPASLPGQAGSLYLGIKNGVSFGSDTGFLVQPVALAPGVIGNLISGVNSVIGYDGATPIPNANGELLLGSGMLFPAINQISGYCGFYALKFVITDRGLPTQYFTISCTSQSVVSGADYSPRALGVSMSSAAYGIGSVIQWNDGVSARLIPDSMYLRLPFYNNRIVLASMRVIKYQPA